ncbi:12602_t:CDS:2, partial [Racocetra fulgida]
MTLVAFGYYPVISILQSPYFRLKKIIIQDKYQNDKVLGQLLAEKRVNYQLLTKNNFERASFARKSQVMLDSIEDPHNFGAILRTSAALAIDGIIIASHNQVPVNSTVIKVSAGGIAHVPIYRISSLGEAVNELKKRGYKIVATTTPSFLSTNKKVIEYLFRHFIRANFPQGAMVGANLITQFANDLDAIADHIWFLPNRLIYISTTTFLFRKSSELGVAAKKRIEKDNEAIYEKINNLEYIKAVSGETYEEKKLFQRLDTTFRLNTKALLYRVLFEAVPTYVFIPNVPISFIFLVLLLGPSLMAGGI